MEIHRRADESDGPFEKTAQIGEQLLMEAISESDWRDLPEDILSLYAAKCEREERRLIEAINLAKVRNSAKA